MDRSPTRWSIVCFGGVDWRSHQRRSQFLMKEFALRGHDVLYVDNLGTRFPRPRDARRVARRIANRVKNERRFPGHDAAEVKVHSPLALPLQHLAPVRRAAAAALTKAVTQHLRGRPLVVWTYLPNPVIRDVASRVRADALVYDWCDDASTHMLTTSERNRRRVRASEDAMASAADVVFVASQELRRRRRPANDNAHVIEHGINMPHEGGRVPADVERAPRPLIGFVGSISAWVDLDLVDALARARPDWTYVMVGPVKVPRKQLPHRHNLIYVGERTPHDVNALLRTFDAAIVPYVSAPAVDTASSLKLREYLAHRLPVVTVDFPDIDAFRNHVAVAEGADDFVRKLDGAIRQERSAFEPPPLLSWEQVATRMSELVAETLTSESAGITSAHRP